MDRRCTKSPKKTTIDQPQIYALEQRDPRECYYVLLQNVLHDTKSKAHPKMAISYHKLSLAKNVILLIYEGDVEDGKPLRALVGHEDWSIYPNPSSTNSNLAVFNLEGCQHSLDACLIDKKKVRIPADTLYANKVTFVINATNPPLNMLGTRNEFVVDFVKIKTAGDDNLDLTVILSMIAGVIFSVLWFCYVAKQRKLFSSVEPVDVENNVDRDDGPSTDEENSDSVAPANKSLIDLATTRYTYKESVFEKELIDLDDRCCPICILNFEENDKLVMLPCSHLFHARCATTWLSKHQASCPLCKRDIVVTALQVKKVEGQGSDSLDLQTIERYKARRIAFKDAERRKKYTKGDNHNHHSTLKNA